MNIDILAMYEQLAALGQAPVDGCSLFGVGLDDAFARLKAKYLDDAFNRGQSAEKFVLGPYGSGKTHFVNQLNEVARAHGCVTATVQLAKNIDYTDGVTVYREIAQEVRVGDGARGIRHFIPALLDRARQALGADAQGDEAVDAWVEGIRDEDFVSHDVAEVAHRAMRAYLTGATDAFDQACRWLSGEFGDARIARAAGTTKKSTAEARVLAGRARITLFQLAHYAGFPGSVLVFDEAEQGLAVNKPKMASIFSQLMQELNALAAARNASALVVFAFTPDVRERIAQLLPALEQRLKDPGRGEGFFDGNTRAPIIDLTLRGAPASELEAMGRRLVDVFAAHVPNVDSQRMMAVRDSVSEIARDVVASIPGASARREMVRRIATQILRAHEGGSGASSHPQEPEV